MLRALADVVACLAGLVALLVLLLVVIRVAALRRVTRARRFGPSAAASLGTYLAGSGARPAPDGPGERALFRAIAQDALADLRGDDRDRLVALMGQLGFTQDAMFRLKARRAVTRRRAAEMLASLATPLAVPAVTDALADRDVLVRTTCACTLAVTGTDDVVPAIVAVAERDAPAAPGAAASVVLALARNRPEALAPLLAPGALPAIRRIAVTIAADLRLAQFAGLLQVALADTDDVAVNSARGLGMIGEFAAVDALAQLGADDTRSAPVRAAAADALGAIGDPASLQVLERLLAAPDWSLRAAAAGALARLGEPGRATLHRTAAAGPPEAAALAGSALEP
jgi:HEAT repeat protein